MPLLLLPFLLLLHPLPISPLTHPSDVSALRAFHSSILPSSIPSFSCLSSWNFSLDPCAHFPCGISCSPSAASSSARVTLLSLDPAGYSSPSLPASLSLLPLLHLDLSSNLFPAPLLPSSLPRSLLTLSLSSSALSGPLPALPLPRLLSLDLSRNSLTGPLPSPLPHSLVTLDLSFNSFSGSVPPILPLTLTSLALRSNLLSGPLDPSPFSPLQRLQILDLSSNSLSGPLPSSLLLLPSLQQLALSNNSLSSLDVPSCGRNLAALDLAFNSLRCPLPPGLARCSSLTALSLSHNGLTGSIPPEYGRHKKGRPFRRLFLDGNFLVGKVPAGLADDLAGSFADNCLEGCPEQKPADTCRAVYGHVRHHRIVLKS